MKNKGFFIIILLCCLIPAPLATALGAWTNTFKYQISGPSTFTETELDTLAAYDRLILRRISWNIMGTNISAFNYLKNQNPDIEVYLYWIGRGSRLLRDDGLPASARGSIGRWRDAQGHSMGAISDSQANMDFLLKSGAGEYIRGVTWDETYVADPGNTRWHSYFTEAIITDTVGMNWEYDGVFLDVTTYYPTDQCCGLSATYGSNVDAWDAAMNSFLQGVTAGMFTVNQKTASNHGSLTWSDVDYSDKWVALDLSLNRPNVLFLESGFCTLFGPGDVQFHTETKWRRVVDLLGQINNSELFILSHSDLEPDQPGTDNFGKPFNFWDAFYFAWGSFQLGKNTTSNNSYFDFDTPSGDVWYPDDLTLIDLGEAAGPYQTMTVNFQTIYFREFENGYVYVNPTRTNVTGIPLPQSVKHRTHDNRGDLPCAIPTITTLDLAAHRAAFLVKTNETLPKVAFTLAESAGEESVSPVLLEVVLDAASPHPVSVNYAATGGTATNGEDYQLDAGTLTFPPGEITATLQLDIVPDTDPEGNETVTVSLSDPVCTDLGATPAHTYTIVQGLLTNPGFESGLTDYSRFGDVTTVTTEAHSGARSLRIKGDGARNFSCNHDLTPVLPDTEYTLEAYIKTVALSNDAKIIIREYDSRGVLVKTAEFGHTRGTTLWSKKERVFTTQGSTVQIKIGMYISWASGTAYFDDLRLIQGTDDTPPPPPKPVISITSPDATAAEEGAETGMFQISRTGDTDAPLTVNVTYSGTADPTDYEFVPDSLLIPFGSVSEDILITPENDDTPEGVETVIANIESSSEYEIGVPGQAMVTIADNDSQGLLGNPGFEDGLTDYSRFGDVSTVTTEAHSGLRSLRIVGNGAQNYSCNHDPVAVDPDTEYTVGGYIKVAGLSNDAKFIVREYDSRNIIVRTQEFGHTRGTTLWNGHQLTFTTHANTRKLKIGMYISWASGTAYFDDLSLSTGSGGGGTEPPKPVVSIQATDATAMEENTETGAFQVSRTGDTDTALTVFLTYSGGTDEFDHAPLPGSVIIPVNATSETILVVPVDDDLPESMEAVIAGIAVNPDYENGLSSQATVNILDNDGQELLTNPGFENGLTDYTRYGDVVAVTSEAHTGSRSLRITGDGSHNYNCNHAFTDVLPNTTYLFEGYVKTAGLSSDAKFLIREYDSRGVVVNSTEFGHTRGSTAWAAKQKVFTTRAQTAKLKIGMYISWASGTAYFDDLQLSEN